MKTPSHSTLTHDLGNYHRRLILKLTGVMLALTASFAFAWYSSDRARAGQGAPETVAADIPASMPMHRRIKGIDPLLEEQPIDLPLELQRLRGQNGEPDVGGVDSTFLPNVTEGLAQGTSLASQPDGKYLV